VLLIGGLLALTAGWYAVTWDQPDATSARYIEGVVGRPERVNPLLAFDNEVDADLAALVFSGLMRAAGDGALAPDLAERWEVTPDGLTYTFHLRPGLFWHDGERLDAHDVAFTIGLVQAPGFQGPADLAARWANIEVLVPDDLTFIARLPAPAAGFLAQCTLGIVPKHVLDGVSVGELARAGFNRAPIGSGPYRLERLTDQAAKLVRHPSYHRGAPALAELELRFYPDPGALERAIVATEVQGALLPAGTPRATAQTLVAARPDLVAAPLTESGYTALYFNTLRAPLDDAALRRALAAALDLEALAAAATGAALPGDGPIVPGSWAYTPHDATEDAAALFDAAGWRLGAVGVRQRDGQPLSLTLFTNQDAERETLAALAAEQLRGAGAAVEVRVLPAPELLRLHVQPRDFGLLLFGATTDVDPDPYGGWHTSQIAAGGGNLAGIHDPESDQLIEAARVTIDTAERRELYAAFTEHFTEIAPAVILLYPQRVYLHPSALEGLQPGLLFHAASRFADVDHWRFTE